MSNIYTYFIGNQNFLNLAKFLFPHIELIKESNFTVKNCFGIL